MNSSSLGATTGSGVGSSVGSGMGASVGSAVGASVSSVTYSLVLLSTFEVPCCVLVGSELPHAVTQNASTVAIINATSLFFIIKSPLSKVFYIILYTILDKIKEKRGLSLLHQ